MADEKKLTATQRYASDLNIPCVNMHTAMLAVYLGAASRTPTIIAAESATGKTEMMKQLALRNGAEPVLYHLAHCEPGDLRGIPYPVMGTQNFEYLRDQRLAFGDDPRCQLVIMDEVNRAARDVLNAAFPMWASRMIGDHKLGDNVVIVGLINPPGGAYSVNAAFSTEPAMRRRACMVAAEFNPDIFLQFARDHASASRSRQMPKLSELIPKMTELLAATNTYHPTVVDYLVMNPNQINDVEAAEKGSVYSNPAGWELISQLFYTLDVLEKDYGVLRDDHLLSAAIRTKIAGHVGIQTAHLLLQFVESKEFKFDMVKLVCDLENYTEAKIRVQELTAAGESGRLASLASLFVGEMFRSPDLTSNSFFHPVKKLAGSFVTMLLLLPPTVASTFKRNVELEINSTFGVGAACGREFYQNVSQNKDYKRYIETHAALLKSDEEKMK